MPLRCNAWKSDIQPNILSDSWTINILTVIRRKFMRVVIVSRAIRWRHNIHWISYGTAWTWYLANAYGILAYIYRIRDSSFAPSCCIHCSQILLKFILSLKFWRNVSNFDIVWNAVVIMVRASLLRPPSSSSSLSSVDNRINWFNGINDLQWWPL